MLALEILVARACHVLKARRCHRSHSSATALFCKCGDSINICIYLYIYVCISNVFRTAYDPDKSNSKFGMVMGFVIFVRWGIQVLSVWNSCTKRQGSK